jgi:DnaJ-class molecular chaperone
MLSNLPNGTLARDVSDPDECPNCEGYGRVEAQPEDDGLTPDRGTNYVTCPECSGIGLTNYRVNR